MTKRDSIDERLAELGAATADLVAPSGLTDRVMSAVEREPAQGGFWAARGVALAVFAAAAAIAVFSASGAQSSFDQQALSSFDTVELEP
jgi:hypothetical protein